MEATNKKKAHELRLKGNAFFKNGDYNNAVVNYTTALKYDSNNPTLYSNLSQAHLSQNRFADAEKQACKAIELDGDLLKGYYRAAKAAENLGQIERAKKYLNDGMNRPRITSCDDLLGLYCQLVKCEVPSDISSKFFEPLSKRAKKRLRMTRTDADDQFLKMLETLRNENPSEYYREQLSIKRKRVDLEVSLKDGSESLLMKKMPRTAAMKYKVALDIIADVHPEELLEISLMDKVVLKYAFSICCMLQDSKDITKAVEHLSDIRNMVDDSTFPAVLYPLSKIYIQINRYPQALELVEQGLGIIASGRLFAELNWPGSDVVIPETTAEGLQNTLTLLKPDCQGYHKPDAICKHIEERCESLNQQILPSRLIFFSDPDFNGFMVVHCQSKCLIEYHLVCWKDFKESCSISMFSNKLSDKDMLGKRCPTDGCKTLAGDVSVIVRIELIVNNREVKFHCEREPVLVVKDPKQTKKKTEFIKPTSMDKEKPKPKLRPRPPPEPIVSKRQFRFRGMDSGDPDGSGDEDVYDKERLIDHFRELREKNNNYAADKCWYLNKPFYGRADLPPDRWLLTKDATHTKEFIASYFFELLTSREPMSIDDLLDNWEEAIDNYPEFREITMKPGFPGIVKYLIESYRFVLINDYITVARKVPVLEAAQLEETIECVEFYLAESASLVVNYAHPEPPEDRPGSSRSSGCASGAGDGTPFDDIYIRNAKTFEEKAKPAVSENRVKTPVPDSSGTFEKFKQPTTPVKVKPVKQEPLSPVSKNLGNIQAGIDTNKGGTNSLLKINSKTESTPFIWTNIPNATIEKSKHGALDLTTLSIPFDVTKKNFKESTSEEKQTENKETDSYSQVDNNLKEYLSLYCDPKNKLDEDNKLANFDKATVEDKKFETEVKAAKVVKEKKVGKPVVEESKAVKVTTDEKVVKPLVEDKKLVKLTVDDKKVVKQEVEVKKPTVAAKKTVKSTVIEKETGTTKMEPKGVQTDVSGDHYEMLEIKLDGVAEENRLMQKRVENADEITMVLLDNRKKAQVQLEALMQEKQEAVRERDDVAKERDESVRERDEAVHAAEEAIQAAEVAKRESQELKAELEKYKNQPPDTAALKNEPGDTTALKNEPGDTTALKNPPGDKAAFDRMKRAYFLSQRELVTIRRDLCHLTYEETMNQLQVALSYPRLPPPKREQLRAMRDDLSRLQRTANETNADVIKKYDSVQDHLDDIDIAELPKVVSVEVPAHVLTALLEVQNHCTRPEQQPAPLPAAHNSFYPRMPPVVHYKGIPMPNQGIPMPNQGIPMPNQGYPMPNQRMLAPNMAMHNHAMMVQKRNMLLQKHNMSMQNPAMLNNGIHPGMPKYGMPQQNQGMLNHGMPQQNQGMPNHGMPQQNQGMPNHGMPQQNPGMFTQNLMGPPVAYKKYGETNHNNAVAPSGSSGATWAATWNGAVDPRRTHSNSSAESNASAKNTGVEKKENGHHVTRPKLESVITELPAVPGRPGTATDRLNAMLMERFPNSSVEELQECIEEVRHNNNDSLQGFKTETIMNQIEAIIKRNAKKSSKPAWRTVDNEVNWTNSNKDDCVICMEPIEEERLAELSCKHQFHVHCIRKWLELESVCPTCMRFTKMVSDYPPLK